MTYFKETTRTILSQREKDETICAVNQAMIYLGERYTSYKMPEFGCLSDFPASFQYSRNIMPYMSRMVTLIKGSTQPKRFYRKRREAEIFWETIRIVKETGADRKDVEEMFTQYMHSFLHLIFYCETLMRTMKKTIKEKAVFAINELNKGGY
jgi:hypothetical protein